jgi:hypothetical protein
MKLRLTGGLIGGRTDAGMLVQRDGKGVFFVEAGGGRLALISVVKVIEPAFVKGEKVIFS